MGNSSFNLLHNLQAVLSLSALFIPLHIIKARGGSISSSLVDSDWTNWLHYIQLTSNQSFSDAKGLSPSLIYKFTDNSCLKSSPSFTTTNVTTSTPWLRIFVASNGSGSFTTIQEAVDSVPEHNTVPTLICIGAGDYREKVEVSKTKDFITFIGDSSGDGTSVVWNDTASTMDPDTNLPLRTFNSPTVAINAKFFVARNVIFQNDAPPPQPGEIGGQAVALRITGDCAAFYNCKFLGHQDTLYDQKGRHYFKDCFIQGSVDFIFGNGRSLYKDCYIHALASTHRAVGSVTAQKRSEPQLDSGFTFLECNLTGDGSVYLGRAWGEDSRVVFAYTWMDNVVAPQGWNDWGIPSRERTVFYAEFQCFGPGANTSTRVPWAKQLTPEQAQPFLSIGFINGGSWLQET